MRPPVAHAFVDDLARPVLPDRDVHHFSRVLRLREGEVVSVSDGRGGRRLCEWLGGPLGPLNEPTWQPPPTPAITVCFALTKGERPEWAVQRLTEAGADRVVVMVTDRCVPRWSPGSEGRHLERLREVARQAAMQSRRLWMPAVEGPMAFSAVVSGESEANDGGANGGGPDAGNISLAVPGGAPLSLNTPTVLVGPEGGWTGTELAAVPPARHVGLGPNVLRAETAALAAGLLLVAMRSGLAVPVEPTVPSEASVPRQQRS
jgi:16S rRNA (uracil1498-N3)-methyltransferase